MRKNPVAPRAPGLPVSPTGPIGPAVTQTFLTVKGNETCTHKIWFLFISLFSSVLVVGHPETHFNNLLGKYSCLIGNTCQRNQ